MKIISFDPAKSGRDHIKILKFKYLVLDTHPIFQYVNRKCFTIKETENVKDGLMAIGYEVEIEKIEEIK